jgi:hypothetical protein
MLHPDEIALKLHTAHDGTVWYASGIAAPRSSGQISDVFLMSPPVYKMGLRIRVLGVPQNAELITALYLRRRKNEIASVEVAGPNICESREELDDPEIVIHRMRTNILASACGGWHTINEDDYLTYALVARMQRTADAFDSTTAAYYQAHPVYRALSFIPTLSAENAAKLVKIIVDPRWYVDRRSPERGGKLALYMGLTPDVQKRVSDSSKLIHKSRDVRCDIVLETWKSQHAGSIDLVDPRNFLYRIYKAAGEGWRGDLRASQAFLRYLRYNWLAAIERRTGVKDGLFAPDMFFKTPGEQGAYKQHMAV